MSSSPRADGLLNVFANPVAPFSTFTVVFPNWAKVPTASFTLEECSDLTCAFCATSTIKGVTIVNYGTATGGAAGDVTGMYFNYLCGADDTAIMTMTFAGNWDVGGPVYPAWTWAGTLALPNDPCGTDCYCYPSLNVYTDVGACPQDGATIALGPLYNTVFGRGGITDSCGFDVPVMPTISEQKKIMYAYKTADRTTAAPGDTITYTIYYGKPGGVNLTSITVMDSIPQYTHFSGSSSPAPDAGWAPDWGPPIRLRWTIPGPIGVGGGPTGEVSFQVTADWGNGEMFEPGSGDVAAPEGTTLGNLAHVSWEPSTGGGACLAGRSSNSAATVVRRYLFYMLGDNDILFASRVGVPDDEIIYSVFIKNLSSKKLWDIYVWDTVPASLDTWAMDFGFEDPCTGWTMTPSGCAAASPGRIVTGGKTLLTWKLDMPSGTTIELKWKARVNPSASPGNTAINTLSVQSRGQPGIVGGSGHQGPVANFVHLANIILRTTYTSYVGIGGSGLGKLGMFIVFYPLNRATNFEFRGIESGPADPWTVGQGLSASIGSLLGTCIGGFSCSLGFSGGTAGCKSERMPADYSCFSGGSPAENPIAVPCSSSSNPAPSGPCSNSPVIPYHYIYKVLANSPVLWQVFSCNGNNSQTFTPSTSLAFSGFIHYAFNRRGWDTNDFNIMNTSVNANNVLDPNLATTVHQFYWDPATLAWNYMTSYEVDRESHVVPNVSVICNAHYRWVSSVAKLVIRESTMAFTSSQSNWGGYTPARNEGMLTVRTPGDAVYIFPNMKPGYLDSQVAVTNLGAVNSTYKIEFYIPRNTQNPPVGVPPYMADTSGTWVTRVASHSVPSGFATAANPHVYGTMYDSTFIFSDPPSGTGGIYRLTLLSGGPVEVAQGARIFSNYDGGTLVHPLGGGMVGSEFWISIPWQWLVTGSHCDTPYQPTMAIDIFCPKTGMAVQAVDTDGYTARYTTDGPDQCVSFGRFTPVASGARRNIKITTVGGDAICIYNACQPSHKFFTAPFLSMGVHYDVLVPPIAYLGQSFWITVVAVEAGGSTKTDYAGTTSFTSTDPKAQMGGGGMDVYNYTWVAATDNGVKIFINVVFNKLGMMTIVAADINDGSIIGLATVNVVGVDVKLFKEPRFLIAASGDTTRFSICWSNYSSSSAFTFVITDAVPVGTTYVPDAATGMMCGSTDGVAVTVAYSTSTVTAPPAAFTTTTGALPLAVRWLRWTVPVVGVQTTGCACFRVSVD